VCSRFRVCVYLLRIWVVSVLVKRSICIVNTDVRTCKYKWHTRTWSTHTFLLSVYLSLSLCLVSLLALPVSPCLSLSMCVCISVCMYICLFCLSPCLYSLSLVLFLFLFRSMSMLSVSLSLSHTPCLIHTDMISGSSAYDSDYFVFTMYTHTQTHTYTHTQTHTSTTHMFMLYLVKYLIDDNRIITNYHNN